MSEDMIWGSSNHILEKSYVISYVIYSTHISCWMFYPLVSAKILASGAPGGRVASAVAGE